MLYLQALKDECCQLKKKGIQCVLVGCQVSYTFTATVITKSLYMYVPTANDIVVHC